jgi:hypothetical protein
MIKRDALIKLLHSLPVEAIIGGEIQFTDQNPKQVELGMKNAMHMAAVVFGPLECSVEYRGPDRATGKFKF